MALYRIFTEDTNEERIKAALAGFALDFTLFRGTGSWKQKEEPSLIVELDGVPRDLAVSAAKAIKKLNNQEAVLLQEFAVKSKLL